jgi:hypothetical protein
MARNRRATITNNNEMYSKVFRRRDVKQIIQYETANYGNLTNKLEDAGVIYRQEVWRYGTKLYNVAYNVYNDPTMWWVIALVNRKFSEADFQDGEVYLIPTPIGRVLDAIGVV